MSERGDYAGASDAFRSACALTRHADLLYNTYSAQERNGQIEEAAEALEAYLHDSDPAADRRDALELRLERLRSRIDQARLDATALERERERAAAELLEERSGQAAAEGRAIEERRRRLSQVRSSHRTSDTLLAPGAVAMGIGGLGLISFGVFAALSESEDQSLASSCGRDAGRICTERDVANLRTFNTNADVSWAVGSRLAVVGAVIVLVGESLRPVGDAEATTSVRPLASPTAAGAAIGGVW